MPSSEPVLIVRMKEIHVPKYAIIGRAIDIFHSCNLCVFIANRGNLRLGIGRGVDGVNEFGDLFQSCAVFQIVRDELLSPSIVLRGFPSRPPDDALKT